MQYCCGGRKIGRYSATVVLLLVLVLVFQLLILYGTFAERVQHPASWTNGV
jgi:sensor histidine kinase regulating citrate/malate metabolism